MEFQQVAKDYFKIKMEKPFVDLQTGEKENDLEERFEKQRANS